MTIFDSGTHTAHGAHGAHAAANASQEPRTLVFLHGSGDSAHHWDRLARHLSAYPVVALDLPGHGVHADRPGPANMKIADYADAVRVELARLNLRDVCLIGHSLGAAVALRLAVDHPSLVGRLVLVGSGARLHVLPTLLEMAGSDPTEAVRHLVRMGFAPGHEDDAERYAATVPPTAPGVLRRDLAACDQFDMMNELGRVSQQTLIITGEDDALTPPKYARFLQEHVTRARLKLIAHAGHFAAIEAPEAVADTIRVWLAQ